MDKFLNHKETLDCDKESSSETTSMIPKIKLRRYSQEYLNFGFITTEIKWRKASVYYLHKNFGNRQCET